MAQTGEQDDEMRLHASGVNRRLTKEELVYLYMFGDHGYHE